MLILPASKWAKLVKDLELKLSGPGRPRKGFGPEPDTRPDHQPNSSAGSWTVDRSGLSEKKKHPDQNPECPGRVFLR